MSVQAKNKHTTPANGGKKAESLNTPRKRKHDTDERESSKKKTKRRSDDGATASVAIAQEPAESEERRTKKGKSKHKLEAVTQLEDVEELQDIELPDAPATEEEPNENTVAHTGAVLNDLEGSNFEEEEEILKLLESEDPSSFYSTRLSLYVSIPAISLGSGTSSILATHLAPLLLTYFPPARGIVLAFSDPVVSTKPNAGINLALLPPRTGDLETQAEVLAETADEFGVCWAWLTATFLVFRPKKGDELPGWINVTSEGFIGLVSYNYFQAAVGKPRIPSEWSWSGPSSEQEQRSRKKGRKGRLRGDGEANGTQETDTQETDTTLVETTDPHIRLDDDGGYFTDADGAKIGTTLTFRVVDTEIVPAHDRHKWSLQINSSLLDDEAEADVVQEERAKFERVQDRSRSRSPGASEVVMSGALGRSLISEGSVASRMSGQTPSRHRTIY